MQPEYLLILALLAMDGMQIVTRFSGGNVVVNLIGNLLSMFIKKLDVSCLVVVSCVVAGDVDIYQWSRSI